MASYTYSLIEGPGGDGAVTAYYGTASMAAINATQSLEFSSDYVESNMPINTAYLLWQNETTESTAFEGIFYPVIYTYQTYTMPTAIASLEVNTTNVFDWDYYSYIRTYSYYEGGLSPYWYLESDEVDGDGNPIRLGDFELSETYELSLDSIDQLSDSEMTVVLYAAGLVTDASTNTSEYQNLGVEDPVVYYLESDGEKIWFYNYASGEMEGIRNKFSAPEGTTSLSLMQTLISSSVNQIYNTSNVSRYNFNKTKAEKLEPNDISSIQIIKNFNIPYRGIRTDLPPESDTGAGSNTGGGY